MIIRNAPARATTARDFSRILADVNTAHVRSEMSVPIEDVSRFLLQEVDWRQYGNWDGFIDAHGLREHLEMGVGEAPEIHREHVSRASGYRRWAPIIESMLRTITPTFSGVRLSADGSAPEMTPMSGWGGAGVYFISRRTERYDYPKGSSCIAYIGKSIEPSGQVIKRAIDHFFAPESGYTLTAFGTAKTADFFAHEVGKKHALVIIQNMRTKEAPALLESMLLRSFVEKYGALPRYNSSR